MVSGELFELFTVTPVTFPPATMSDLCFYLTNTKQGIYVFYVQKMLVVSQTAQHGVPHISKWFTLEYVYFSASNLLSVLFSERWKDKRSAEGVSSGVAEKKCKSVLSVITLQA